MVVFQPLLNWSHGDVADKSDYSLNGYVNAIDLSYHYRLRECQGTGNNNFGGNGYPAPKLRMVTNPLSFEPHTGALVGGQ